MQRPKFRDQLKLSFRFISNNSLMIADASQIRISKADQHAFHVKC